MDVTAGSNTRASAVSPLGRGKRGARHPGPERVTARWLGAMVTLALSVWLFGESGGMLYLLIPGWGLLIAHEAYVERGERRYLLAAVFPLVASAISAMVTTRDTALKVTIGAIPVALLILAMFWLARSDAMPTLRGRLVVRVSFALALSSMAGPLAHPQTWQPATPAMVAAMQGCYVVTASPSVRPFPRVVVLDSVRWSVLPDGEQRSFARAMVAGRRQLTPDWDGWIGYWIEERANAITLAWTQGHGGFRVHLRRDGADLVGRGEHHTDSGLWPRLRVPVRLRKAPC
jgi:hypothetical protein